MAKYEYIHDYQEGQEWMPEKPNTASFEELGCYALKVQVSDPKDYTALVYHVKSWVENLPKAVQVG